MRKVFVFFAILVVASVFLGCSPNRFIVYKHGQAYYFATKREGLYDMLCKTGDFKKVLAAAPTIPPATSKGLYYYNCVKPDANKVQSLFVSLTPDQRKNLLDAFMNEGYEINFWPCA